VLVLENERHLHPNLVRGDFAAFYADLLVLHPSRLDVLDGLASAGDSQSDGILEGIRRGRGDFDGLCNGHSRFIVRDLRGHQVPRAFVLASRIRTSNLAPRTRYPVPGTRYASKVTDFAVSWELSRGRFVDTIAGLSDAQLNWRLHPDCLTLGEAALHVAGVEVSFASQLLGLTLTDDLQRLKSAATDGVVNDKPFPYSEAEITRQAVDAALATAKGFAEKIILEPTPEVLNAEIVSALGPVITGKGALARFAFHPAYHQGQAYLIRTAPGFPTK